MPQRSPEWFAIRSGKLTGSVAGEMLATIKSGEAAARRDLRARLICERLTGQAQEDTYINAAMQRGIEKEPAALAAYEVLTGDLVMPSGFLQHPTIHAGCSLDGYTGEYETVVSIKCPKSATHLRYLQSVGMPSDYVPQMLHELWLTGARRYAFLSFDDRFPEHLQSALFVVERDDKAVEDYAAKAVAFLAEVDLALASLQGWAIAKDVFAAADGTGHP